MKKLLSILCPAALAAAVCWSCVNTTAPLQTRVYSYEESTDHASIKFSAELPDGNNHSARAIRENLFGVMDNQLSHIGSYEGERLFDPYDGDINDTEGCVKYYYDNAFKVISDGADDDVRQRAEYINQDTGIDDAQKEEILSRMPGWEYEFSLEMITDADYYAVFQSQDYIYMGGAHGGVTGAGCITFDKATGSIVEQFIAPGCEEDIQPLLRKGLVEYFADADTQINDSNLNEYLLLEEDLIPIPAWQPYPCEDGLVFVYQQYEIAPYAAGMPSFTVPFEEIAPYLTPEARRIIGQ